MARWPEAARAASKDVRERGNYSGGATAIDGAVRAAASRIEQIMADGGHARPEIVVVTDGDDTVSMKAEELGETRLHAFVVGGGDNSALRALAARSGGVNIRL